jgi:cellulose synthase/poly-beta-1,6-N-acetylglucosamine synthase-like glycosyltransferase
VRIAGSGSRHQWGADTRARLPTLPDRGGPHTLALTRAAVFATVAAWSAFVVTTIWRLVVYDQTAALALEAIAYLAIISLLSYSATAYLLTRIGYYRRAQEHRRVPRAALDELYAQRTPTLTVLVPSFCEEPRIIRKALLSTALQEFPDLRIVLLIDDPPDPADPYHRRLLSEARALPGELAALLEVPREDAAEALAAFEARLADGQTATGADLRELAGAYERAAAWLDELAAGEPTIDHVDFFFLAHILGPLACDLELVADALRAAAADEAALPADRLRQLHNRLLWTFSADLSSFERKRYISLSSEPNKAMNLNSYIGLMGGSHAERSTQAGRVLGPAASSDADLTVPEPDYVLTLDADSVLLPEYCARLVYLLEQPEHADVGVAQTPYSAYPGAPTRLERIAGATTDLQHIVHQGMTHYAASFWVGANAVIRKRALDDISTPGWWGNFRIRRFIQDRTVIEDTESTLDLGIQGWRVHNYPERLSYSATPPDFGSLCIQRRRWANGGLLILGKLRRYVRSARARGEPVGFGEFSLRANYLASITWSNLSLLLLLALPYISILPGPLVVLAAVPYFAVMAADLKRCGYRRLDVLRLYGFNLILLPVNLTGVLKSIGQGITGAKIPFARTPKVRDRTTAPLTFVIIPYLIVAVSAVATVYYARQGHRERAGFAAFNGLLAAYAIVAFIGLRNSAVDVWLNVVKHLYRPARRRIPQPQLVQVAPRRLDWAAILDDVPPDRAADPDAVLPGAARTARGLEALPADLGA